jgi:hypothetical protein
MVLALRETLYDQNCRPRRPAHPAGQGEPKLTNHFPSAEVEEVTPAS